MYKDDCAVGKKVNRRRKAKAGLGFLHNVKQHAGQVSACLVVELKFSLKETDMKAGALALGLSSVFST